MTKQFSSLALSALCTFSVAACHLDQAGSQKSTNAADPGDLDGGSGANGGGGAHGGGMQGGSNANDAGETPVADASVPSGDAQVGGDPDAGGPVCSGDPSDPLCAFAVKRKITFDATQLASALVDFPVLITLDPTRIDYGKTQPNGADVRFLDSDGLTWLSHDIERWQPGGISSVWVKVPRFAPGAVHDIYMVYGSETALPAAQAADVFSADYVAVYHLGDDLTDHTVRDVLGAFDGATSLTMDGSDSVAARIGKGVSIDGAGHRIQLGDLDLSKWTGFTLEAWVLQQTKADSRVLCQAANLEDKDHVACLSVADDNVRMFLSTQGEDGETQAYDAPGVVQGSWMHLAVAWDAQSERLRILKNGSQIGSFEHKGSALNDSEEPMIVGNVALTDLRFLNGVVDEIRVSSVARSNLWLQATVATVNDSVTTYGPEEPFAP